MSTPPATKGKPLPELRKQVSFYLPLSAWLRMRDESVRRGIPIAEICRGWIEPEVQQLPASKAPAG